MLKGKSDKISGEGRKRRGKSCGERYGKEEELR
jgi:hypothetical protein